MSDASCGTVGESAGEGLSQAEVRKLTEAFAGLADDAYDEVHAFLGLCQGCTHFELSTILPEKQRALWNLVMAKAGAGIQGESVETLLDSLLMVLA